jgi:two-component system, NarL family, response regulator DegU
MIKVLVCEDQTLLRDGLVTLLSMEPGLSVVGEAVDGHEAVEKAAALRPDVVLMDVRLPLMDGVEATRAITEQHPDTKVIILTTYDKEEYVLEGVKAGAMAYLLKDTAAPDLVRTITRVHRGERFIQPGVASKILFDLARQPERAEEEPLIEPLSEREIEIITLLAQGMSNRDVATHLTLAEGTVKNYVSRILSKLRAANRVQAINLARERKLI